MKRLFLCRRVCFLLLWIMMSAALHAHEGQNQTIAIQMVNSKTGQTITSSEIEVSIRAATISAEKPGITPLYVRPSEDGIGTASFPPEASIISAHSHYSKAYWSYVNCDAVKDRREHWYPLKEILASGIVASNGCSKRKAVAKPGEFIFFVRPMTFGEKMKE